MILQGCTSLVACNIYITSAASAALPSLLTRAQDHCRQLRRKQQQKQQQKDQNKESNAAAAAAIVHAYADIPYDRSSFHLAGRSDCVAEVAARLIQNTLDEIELDSNNNDTSDKLEARHPFVGLVDHVAVMPITSQEFGSSASTTAAAATAAREIGSQIDQSNSIKIHYYGLACPNNTPLATVRRKTSFFNSGGAQQNSSSSSGNNPKEQTAQTYEKGECTIGAPQKFVENYNIRLTPNVDFSTAKSLTQALRGRNITTKGMGVPGVEALTLPYNNVYEVACNLLEPKIGGVDQIEDELEKWVGNQRQQRLEDDEHADNLYDRGYFIEKAYRVGTTAEQCLSVLKNAAEDNYWMQYDQQVLSRFNELLGQG